MRVLSTFMVLPVILMLSGLWGCSADKSGRQPKADAVAELSPANGSGVRGVVRFARVEDGVRVMARVFNLSPGPHGLHIHRFGDCRSADAASAGAHFNPGGNAHGGPQDVNRHAGDLGNMVADDSGVATLDGVAPMVMLDGPDSVIGRSVVVHAKADDFKSQPSGASGERQACGVIGIAAE